MDTFGNALRHHRSAQSLSQKSLAEVIGVTRPFISQVEAGDSVFSYETMLRAAIALGLDMDQTTELDRLRQAYSGVSAVDQGAGIKRLAALEAATAALSQTVAQMAEELAALQAAVRRQGRADGDASTR